MNEQEKSAVLATVEAMGLTPQQPEQAMQSKEILQEFLKQKKNVILLVRELEQVFDVYGLLYHLGLGDKAITVALDPVEFQKKVRPENMQEIFSPYGSLLTEHGFNTHETDVITHDAAMAERIREEFTMEYCADKQPLQEERTKKVFYRSIELKCA